jgi:2',3'-cyclic-nucleotide 2'-phosphodiesterase (5'-nucleotidase family)
MKRRTSALLPLLLGIALPFFCAPANPIHAGTLDLRILHVNDFHGFAEAYQPLDSREPLGGLAYLAGKVNALRREKPTLLLAAGDMIQGNNWANLSRGASVIEAMNAMRFDAMVLGNHEFDFGQEELNKRLSEAAFPVLGANVERLDRLKPYVIREIGGVRVGIIGIVTEETPVATHPRNVSGLAFLSAAETVEKKLAEMKNRADIVIVLSHIGHAADRALAEKVKGIDVIVGGHSHTRVLKPVRIGDTLIVQAWEHGKALGVLDLAIRKGKVVGHDGRLEEVKPIPGSEDRAMLPLVEKYRQRMDAILGVRLGEAKIDLDGENVRRKETNLGNLVADILRETAKADAAIINGGTIRTSIGRGEIRVKDVYSVLPFDNYVVAIALTGKAIAEALEHGVSGIEEGAGRFPQVAGLTFAYSRSAPKGSRIREISIAGKPLDPEREYSVATNDFLAVGGDGYRSFAEAVKSSKTFSAVGGALMAEKVLYSDSGRWLRDVVVEYIREKGTIAPGTERRITERP